MRVPATVSWIGLALLGILIAGGISVAASRLASQQIGLASEPLSAGDALAPPASREKPSRQPAPSHRAHRRESTTPSVPPATTTPSPPPATTPEPPANPPAHGDETGQAGEGGDGGGGGGDD